MARSKLAIWSFVLVLIAYLLFFIINTTNIWDPAGKIRELIGPILSTATLLAEFIPVVTLIMGIVALRKIKRKKLKGKGFAIATIILSSIIILYFLLILLALSGGIQ